MSQPNECKHSDYKLCFKLKQHTPIIHFQADQKGATLRATELKPKLDRFLMEYFEEENERRKESGEELIDYEKFLIAGQERAFDYKVRIEEHNEVAPFIEESNFLGNMDKNKKKLSEKYSKGITFISITSFQSNLITAIKEIMPSFLLQTNFGARTSKGYGSFYLFDSINDTYCSPDFSFVNKRVYKFKSIKEKCIDDIKLLNNFFRSGINLPCSTYSQKDEEKDSKHKKGTLKRGCPKIISPEKGTRVYIKSALYNYLNDKTDFTWDKKKIKHKFKPMNENIEDDSRATLARDLFGLSSRQEWQTEKGKMIITKDNKHFSRLKSPIFFKPLISEDVITKANSEVIVTFWANDSYKDMLGKTFTIKSNDRNGFPLSTPIDFSFDDFFDYIVNEYTPIVDRNFENQPEIIAIKRMLADIKEFAND